MVPANIKFRKYRRVLLTELASFFAQGWVSKNGICEDEAGRKQRRVFKRVISQDVAMTLKRGGTFCGSEFQTEGLF